MAMALLDIASKLFLQIVAWTMSFSLLNPFVLHLLSS